MSGIPALDRIISILRASSGDATAIPPTLLYNENWMMRLVLSSALDGIDCLPFLLKPDVRWFSEARLPTRFPHRSRLDKQGEPSTHADGVVGHFSIATNTKASLELNATGSQFVVLEGKVFSALRKNVKNAQDYNQAARTIACMAESLYRCKRPLSQWTSLGFFVLAPESQIARGLFSDYMQRECICETIRHRITTYQSKSQGEMNDWEELWFKPLLDKMTIQCVSWESIVEIIKGHDSGAGSQIEDFYQLTIAFNQSKIARIARNKTAGKGVREASLVYIPQITQGEQTVLHLSVRRGSYRLRRYGSALPAQTPKPFRIEPYTTAQQLIDSGLIVRTVQLSEADMKHSLTNEPEYWCKLIREVNSKLFAPQD
ncbi:MAG: hypothetical protein J0H49_35940 [Acidobacteria bacterium]|nr:hypothetical protein [Acidobacteriota bacterium]